MSDSIDLSEITAEAVITATEFLESAESWVDNQFGAGYAEKHPGLVAGYMQACTMVYQAHRIGRSLDDLTAAIGGLLEQERGNHGG